MKRWLGSALSTLAVAWSAFASGPEQYLTPFVDRSDLERCNGWRSSRIGSGATTTMSSSPLSSISI